MARALRAGRPGDSVAAWGRGAMLALDAAGLPYTPYDHLGATLDKDALADQARRLALGWHALPEVAADPRIAAVAEHRGCPVLEALHSGLYLAFFELLQARAFLGAVLDAARPEAVAAAPRPAPCTTLNRLHLLTEGNGLEAECAPALCAARGLPLEALPPDPYPGPAPATPGPGDSGALGRAVRRALGLVRAPLPRPPRGLARVLLFLWGGNAGQFLEALPAFARRGLAPAVVLTGGVLPDDVARALAQAGVPMARREDLALPWEPLVHRTWAARAARAVRAVRDSAALRAFFSDEAGGFFDGPTEAILAREVGRRLPQTVTLMDRTAALLDRVRPRAVFCHFALHPEEICDILPARARGIGTLTSGHGAPGHTNAPAALFAAHAYATPGSVFSQALARSTACPQEAAPVAGDARLAALAPHEDRGGARRELGFDPDRPLVVFCDNSSLAHSVVARHAGAALLRAARAIRDLPAGAQVVLRVHKGADYAGLRAAIAALGDADLHFQVSSELALTALLRGADALVSHHTTAVTEALLCGVPVVLLTMLAQEEPMYDGCPAIREAASREAILEHLRTLLAAPPDRAAVREAARPLLARAMNLGGPPPGEALAGLLADMADTGPGETYRGFADWRRRLAASAAFCSGPKHRDDQGA